MTTYGKTGLPPPDLPVSAAKTDTATDGSDPQNCRLGARKAALSGEGSSSSSEEGCWDLQGSNRFWTCLRSCCWKKHRFKQQKTVKGKPRDPRTQGDLPVRPLFQGSEHRPKPIGPASRGQESPYQSTDPPFVKHHLLSLVFRVVKSELYHTTSLWHAARKCHEDVYQLWTTQP